MSGPIVQFGTSRFLQAHVDLMLSEAKADRQDVGPVTVVETTGSEASRRRVEAFAGAGAYPVRIRGLRDGQTIDEERQVTSVVDGLSARADLAALCDVVSEAGYLVSNTGDTGYDLPAHPVIDAEGWRSFPELLTFVLHERFIRNGRPITILPCELISRNGAVLKALTVRLAGEAGLEGSFRNWLENACIWCNSLVDRIVSAPLDPIGAIAEPYAFWGIEDQLGFIPPCSHPDIHVVEDLGPFERQKLFLLNLAHTLLAQRWQDERRDRVETVREIIGDAVVRDWLRGIMESEVVPAFEDNDSAGRYWTTCLERFANPYLDHRLADIAQNHRAKIARRAGGFVRWAAAGDSEGARRRFPRLYAALPVDDAVSRDRSDA